MVGENVARLVQMSEINAAVNLWNSLSTEEIACDDPFGGQLGRSGASAYNFLLLATSRRAWMEAYLENEVKRMRNYKNPDKQLSRNKDHTKHLIENPERRVCGVQPLIRVNERLIQVNPFVLPKITFPYINAAISD